MEENEAQAWVEAVLGEKFPGPYAESLQNGATLCKLMNIFSPGAIKKINTSGANFKLMENITKYIMINLNIISYTYVKNVHIY